MEVIILVFLFILGACFGSFLCCQARRLHLRAESAELSTKKLKKSQKSGQTAKPTQSISISKPIKNSNHKSHTAKTHIQPGHRSVCLTCGEQLKWYENLPLISWLALRGKCRYCQAKIGFAEFLSELGLGLAFLAIGVNFDFYNTSPIAWIIFILTLFLILCLGFLAIYDGLYGELPSLCLTISIICAIIILILKQWSVFFVAGFTPFLIIDPLFSIAILSGLYLVLYLISKGQWVGDGDWLLGLSLGLVLASPWLALITLCLANALACFVTIPAYYFGKKHKKGSAMPRIHLGPYLVTAFVIVLTFTEFFQSWL